MQHHAVTKHQIDVDDRSCTVDLEAPFRGQVFGQAGSSALSAARSTKSRESRASSKRRLLDIINSCLLEIGGSKSEQQQAELCSFILELARRTDRKTRRALSGRIAHLNWVSSDLVLFLANDEIDVAWPILNAQPCLSNDDLINISRTNTMEHRVAIAGRDRIGTPVSTALAAFGEQDVIETLLKNQTAVLDEATVQYLLNEEDKYPGCDSLLLCRENLPAHIQKLLLHRLSTKLNDQIIGPDSEEAVSLIEIVKFLASSTSGVPEKSPMSLIADALIVRPRLAIGFLQAGEPIHLYQVLAELTDGQPAKVRKVLLAGNFKEIATLTERAGFTLDAFFALAHLLHQAHYAEQGFQAQGACN